MSAKSPQHDLRCGLSGGADAFDDGAAGELLSKDYFGPLEAPAFNVRVSWVHLAVPAAPAVAGTTLQAWNGSAWVPGTLKRWNGSAWVLAALKRWNGSAWISA